MQVLYGLTCYKRSQHKTCNDLDLHVGGLLLMPVWHPDDNHPACKQYVAVKTVIFVALSLLKPCNRWWTRSGRYTN